MPWVRFRVDQSKHNAKILCIKIIYEKEEKKSKENFADSLISVTRFPFFLMLFIFLFCYAAS